jgi:hypothetical protein
MNKTLKLFSLLFVLIFSMVSADPETVEDKFRSFIFEKYRLTVTDVDPELHCFKLSNKLVCNVPKKDWGTDVLPEVGDRVVLAPIVRLHSHRSTHIEQGELRADIRGPDGRASKMKVDVWISGEAEYQLYFVSNDLVHTDSGWFSDVYEDVVLLSDRSGWIRKSKEMNVFAPGDRIIVSKCSESEYVLINLDQSFREVTSNGKTFGMLVFEVVEPFNPSKITKE